MEERFKVSLAIEKQPYLRLNDGNKVPMLGLGTWNAQGEEFKSAIKEAIRIGYRHIDTATNYKNEHLIGQAIRECIEERLVKREDLFITTKLWNNSHSRQSVAQGLRESLKKLNLTYVDLYLIHYPIGYLEGGELSPIDKSTNLPITSDVDYIETWLGMEDVKLSNLTKSIGLSNFNCQQISRLISNCSIVPSVNQIETHPYLVQNKLINFCRSKGIQVTAYSPLGCPGRFLDQPDEPHLIEDPLVMAMAKKYNKSVAQILIRYQLDRRIVCIPKTIHTSRLESNFKSLKFKLTEADLVQLDSLNRNFRTNKFERCLGHKYYPFDEE